MRNLFFRPGRLAVCMGVFAALGVWALVSASAFAQSASDAATPRAYAGSWDLAFERANRRCRINLTVAPAHGGYAVMMPAGCRRAFPLLTGALSWSIANDSVVLQGEGRQSLMTFTPKGAPFLSAWVGEGDVYTLTPSDDRRQAMITALAPGGAASAAVASAAPAAPSIQPVAAKASESPALPPPPASQVAGNYAVMRGPRDTGCMITLDGKDHGPKGSFRAKLAPACADQGIVIFDPAGWEVTREGLRLIAKKGHETDLKLQDDGTWANASKGAGSRVLTLKRL